MFGDACKSLPGWPVVDELGDALGQANLKPSVLYCCQIGCRHETYAWVLSLSTVLSRFDLLNTDNLTS